MGYEVQEFFDQDTNTLTYVVFDSKSRDCVVLDPVLNYEPLSSRIFPEQINWLCRFIIEKNLKPHYVLETHVHADHLSGAQFLKKKFPDLKTVISDKISLVQKEFAPRFPYVAAFDQAFDVLVSHGDELVAGSLKIGIIETPGHTPACVTYLIGDMAFTGDALFMPDFGTGRCDFPGGSAEVLFESVTQRLYKLPSHTKFYTGHDYMPGGRSLAFMATLEQHLAHNIHINEKTQSQDFVRFRSERDKTLSAPKLLLQSLQVNINGGRLPKDAQGKANFLVLPLTVEDND